MISPFLCHPITVRLWHDDTGCGSGTAYELAVGANYEASPCIKQQQITLHTIFYFSPYSGHFPRPASAITNRALTPFRSFLIASKTRERLAGITPTDASSRANSHATQPRSLRLAPVSPHFRQNSVTIFSAPPNTNLPLYSRTCGTAAFATEVVPSLPTFRRS